MNQKVKKVSPYQANNRYEINRKRRLEKHLRKHPEDAQARASLTSGSTNPTRKASKEKLGWLTKNKNLGETIKSKFIGTVTKQEANNWAKFIKLSKKVLFWTSPVTTYKEDGAPVTTLKHVNKLSNFKGRMTAKTAALKAKIKEQLKDVPATA